MPAAFPTTETFSAGTPETQMKDEQRLRLRSGTIDSNFIGSVAEGWVLTTTWNVIGEQ